MTKELECLKRIDSRKYLTEREHKEFLKIVEQALQRLEAIDNSKPNEALEDFRVIKFKTINAGYDYGYKVWDKIEQALLKLDFLEDAIDLPTNCFSTFENRNGDEVTVMRREIYEKYQEQEEVLKIIKEKGLPLPEQDIIRQSKDYNEYCIKWSWLGRTANIATQKTKEEFDLLKRCVPNE